AVTLSSRRRALVAANHVALLKIAVVGVNLIWRQTKRPKSRHSLHKMLGEQLPEMSRTLFRRQHLRRGEEPQYAGALRADLRCQLDAEGVP
ncbi:hypothetical protein, partial [Rhizobium lusitanum]|uniref:hypothetical protein n=1 Tax=Rhizobium lusitanum TaxID=293958 RepID=UPI00195B4305